MNSKKNIKWICLILIAIIGLVLGLSAVKKQDKAAPDVQREQQHIEEKEEISQAATESVEIEDKNETIAENVGKEVNDETKNAEKKVIEPTIVSIISEDPNMDTIVMQNEKGEQTTVDIGVKEMDETIPEDSEIIKVQDVDKETYDEEPMKETEKMGDEIEDNAGIKPEWNLNIGQDLKITYKEYEAMSGEEQMLFYYSFANAQAFTEWYNAAKAEYEDSVDRVYIGLDGIDNAVDAG